MRHKRGSRLKRAVIIILVLAVVLTALILDSRYRIDVSEYELEYASLPAAFDGFRIVQISDLHNMEFGSGNENLFEKVMSAKPDIIAVTGDIVDSRGEADYVRELFTGLCAIAPCYYVSGNHEWSRPDISDVLKEIKECGAAVLRNRYEVIERDGQRIAVAGVDDPLGTSYEDRTGALMKKLREEQGEIFTILLHHRNLPPDDYLTIGAPELVLSGHAHGGIIRLPLTDGLMDSSRKWLPSYTSGVYEKDGVKVLVSRGLGNSVPVPRILNNPHIPVAVLRKK